MKHRIPEQKEKEHPLDPPHYFTMRTDHRVACNAPYLDAGNGTPRYIRKWQRYLFEHIKAATSYGEWEDLDFKPRDRNYTCFQKIPLKWTFVDATGYPIGELMLESGPIYGYAYTNVRTFMGSFKIDLMWKWYFDYPLFSDKMKDVLGVLGLISSEDSIIGMVRGQIFGGGYSLNPYGLQKDDTAISFDSDHWGEVDMQETHHYIWKKPVKCSL